MQRQVEEHEDHRSTLRFWPREIFLRFSARYNEHTAIPNRDFSFTGETEILRRLLSVAQIVLLFMESVGDFTSTIERSIKDKIEKVQKMF